MSHPKQPHVAEYYNTISNVSFLVVGFIGLYRALRKGLGASFIYCEIMVRPAAVRHSKHRHHHHEPIQCVVQPVIDTLLTLALATSP